MVYTIHLLWFWEWLIILVQHIPHIYIYNIHIHTLTITVTHEIPAETQPPSNTCASLTLSNFQRFFAAFSSDEVRKATTCQARLGDPQ